MRKPLSIRELETPAIQDHEIIKGGENERVRIFEDLTKAIHQRASYPFCNCLFILA